MYARAMLHTSARGYTCLFMLCTVWRASPNPIPLVQPCPSLQFRPTPQALCVSCPENQTLNTWKTACLCDAGFEADTTATHGANVCHPCKPGTASGAAGFPCAHCASNFYAALSGQLSCDPCPLGLECPGTGPTGYAALAGTDACQGNNIRKLAPIESFALHKLFYVTR